MRKIRLDLDALEVESFPTADGDGERGTVLAQQSIFQCSVADTCFGNPTCLGHATCACACSETDGVRICKSCGPSCYE